MHTPRGFPRRTGSRSFRDRREAGRVLAGRLKAYRDRDDVLVLGLARGGVPVGWEVAAALRAQLDVFLVRKLGVPRWSELAMGAVSSGGGVVMNDNVVSSLRITEEQIRAVIATETAELARRERAYRGGRPLPITQPITHGKVVLLVDDGIATGASMLAAVRALRSAGAGSAPKSIIVAVPVAPPSAADTLQPDADEVVCVSTPADFEAVGQVYADFRQVTDDEVRALLATATH